MFYMFRGVAALLSPIFIAVVAYVQDNGWYWFLAFLVGVPFYTILIFIILLERNRPRPVEAEEIKTKGEETKIIYF